jgi:hypothetical protein
VGDTHGVKNRLLGVVGGDHQVLPTVDVDQPNVIEPLHRRCDQGDHYRALPAEDERAVAGVEHRPEGHAGVGKHVDHLSPRIRPIVAPVSHPACNRAVTVVDDVRIRRPQSVNEACRPYGRRRLLDPRPVRGHARRDSPHTPPTIDHPTTVRRATDSASANTADSGASSLG